MPAPVTSPLFATDVNFSADADAWAGDANKVDPGAARIAEGFEPTTLPAEWLNFVLNGHGSWIDWLEDERARLSTYAGADGPDLPAPVNSVKVFGPGSFTPLVPANWSRTEEYMQSEADTAFLTLDIGAHIPREASIFRVRLLVDPGLARSGGDRMQVSLIGHDYGSSFSSPVIGVATVSGPEFNGITALAQWIVLDLTGTPAPLVDYDAWSLYIRSGSDSGSNKDKIYAARIEFSCSSIRND